MKDDSTTFATLVALSVAMVRDPAFMLHFRGK